MNEKQAVSVTEEEKLWLRIDSIKSIAQDGDLITRLNDNIISHQVRFINNNDKSYSHAGIVQTINGIKMVSHIDADIPGADTIRFEPIDSFLNPQKNISGGLFRYALSSAEISSFIQAINAYHTIKVNFDRTYLMQTDSILYCSEMISKSLGKATAGRIVLESSFIPQHLLKMVYVYLEKKIPLEKIATNKIITIDNLYLNPHCKEIVRFNLKQFPGQ